MIVNDGGSVGYSGEIHKYSVNGYIYGQGIRPPLKQTQEVLCMQLMLPHTCPCYYSLLKMIFYLKLQGLNVTYAVVNNTTFSIIAHHFLHQPSSSTSGTRERTCPWCPTLMLVITTSQGTTRSSREARWPPPASALLGRVLTMALAVVRGSYSYIGHPTTSWGLEQIPGWFLWIKLLRIATEM